MLSPAEPSLIDFYAPLGYREFMYAEQGVVAADLAAAQCEIKDILAASSAVAGCAESDTLTASCDEANTLTASNTVANCAAASCAEANSDDTDGNILPVSDDWILKFENITPEKYNCYREAILAKRAHIKLSEGALRFVAGSAASAGCAGLLLVSAVRCAGSADGAQRTARAEAVHTAHGAAAAEAATDGAQGAARNEVGFAVNRTSSADIGLDTGDSLSLAIAACETGEVPGSLAASELLTFSEAGGDKKLGIAIAKAIAARSGKHSCEYMMPSIAGSESTAVLGLIAADDDDLTEIYGGEQGEYLPYMGFTFG